MLPTDEGPFGIFGHPHNSSDLHKVYAQYSTQSTNSWVRNYEFESLRVKRSGSRDGKPDPPIYFFHEQRFGGNHLATGDWRS